MVAVPRLGADAVRETERFLDMPEDIDVFIPTRCRSGSPKASVRKVANTMTTLLET